MTEAYPSDPASRDMDKAAHRGEPSYLWRDGQERRLSMIMQAAGDLINGRVLDNGCGIGTYLGRLAKHAQEAHGLEFDGDRARQAAHRLANIIQAAGEALPYPSNSFDLILSHEVIEHVHDDRQAVAEMVRVLKPGGRMILFAPNRGYPFETHGVFWRGRYHFGNIPLVNYLPMAWRNRLAPHVRVYSKKTLAELFSELPVRFMKQQIIYGGYDNLIARWPAIGRWLRRLLQWFEATPMSVFGLSHFWVVEKIG